MISAYILLQVGMAGSGGDVHAALHAIPGVKTVHFLSGPTDGMIFVDAADQAALFQTLGKIRAVKGVTATDTRIVWPM
jgi:DNA-binding Lrp family transcriptional regulator